MPSFLLTKLRNRKTWERVVLERLSEPLHLNAMALAVALFGSFQRKVALDLVMRPHNAFCLLRCAEQARRLGFKSVTAVEFGVAAGAGLLNMCRIAEKVRIATGVDVQIVGFDTGSGMPPPADYRDHPDLYQESDFPMNVEKLQAALPAHGRLIVGPIAATVREFLASMPVTSPIGYIVFDVDYYSSTIDAMELLKSADARKYLPTTLAFLDDIDHERHNSWAGELLAVRDFNNLDLPRKLEQHSFLEHERMFRRARWLRQIFFLHVLDHPVRNRASGKPVRSLVNPYLA